MRPRARHCLLFGATLLPLASSCVEVEECDAALELCDIGRESCQEHVFRQTACAREFEGEGPPPVNSITRDVFAASLQPEMEPTAQERLEDEQLATAMRRLGFSPPGTTSDSDASVQALAENVLAFYDPSTKSVTLIETNLGNADRASEVFVLSHELVHAQQDVDIDLIAFFNAHVTSYDSQQSTRALTEGEAVHYSNLTLARQLRAELDTDELVRYYGEQQRALESAAADASVGYQELATAFPYPFGGELVTRAWLDGGRSAIEEIYDDPWPSTSDVLRRVDEGSLADAPVVPDISVAEPPEGWAMLADDTFGGWLTYVFATRRALPGTGPEDVSRGWGGDRLLVFGGETADDVVVIWRLRFADTGIAAELATVGDAAPVEGVWSVVRDGTQVTIVSAADTETLELWQAAVAPATVQSLPPLRTTTPARKAPPMPRPRTLGPAPGHPL